MRFLTRNKIYEKLEPFKNAKKIYLFCEGEREVKYFNYFKGFASNIDIIPIPNDNGKSDPTKLKENCELLFYGTETANSKLSISKEYKDEIWFVIDTDRWNEGNKIDILKSYVLCQNKIEGKWFVVQSNPCFELWLYFHLYCEKPRNSEVKKHISFKEFVNNNIKGGFDLRTMPIQIEVASKNAQNNFELNNNQPDLYSTEVFRLAKNILKFIKPQLDKCLVDMAINNIQKEKKET